MRHNDIRDLTAELLNETCIDVSVEPNLLPLSGEILPTAANTEEGAKCDVAARDLWGKGKKAFSDIKVFNPLAKSYTQQQIKSIYSNAESAKRRKYNHRILHIEHGSFTPIIFSCFGGMGEEAKRYYTKICELLAEKRNQQLSIVKNFVRTQLNFSLIRSAALCIRGSKSHRIKHEVIKNMDIKMAVIDANL